MRRVIWLCRYDHGKADAELIRLAEFVVSI